ncbi:MAG TPA: hypothetical protein VFD92_10505 [Candidatus Binatia bacterium]|nr:hypothetical protein [Candidatus Binatia bacterium]
MAEKRFGFSFAKWALARLALLVAVGFAFTAWADLPAKPDQGALKNIDPPGTESSGVSFFGGLPGGQDQFSGKLLCLRSDKQFTAAAATEPCSGNRVYAISVESGSLVRPLLPGNEHVSRRLDELLGREVIVSGKDYPSTGMFVASDIRSDR